MSGRIDEKQKNIFSPSAEVDPNNIMLSFNLELIHYTVYDYEKFLLLSFILNYSI